jgi:transposase
MQAILAIDMGKNKSVFCDYDARSGEHHFGTLPTGPMEFHDLLVKHAEQLVVIEISPLAGWVSDLCQALGIALKVVNTTSEQWSWKKVKNKSDRDDAKKIATMQAMGQHQYVHMPSAPVRQWRELMGYRDDQVCRATASKNRIRAILDRQGERWPAGKSGWTQERLAELGQMARPLAECEAGALWRGMLHEELLSLNHTLARVAEVSGKLDALAEASVRVRRLKTVPGVGNRTAEVVIAMIDDPSRFHNVRQVGAYTGLTPRRIQSGQMDRQLGISHAGSRLLRKMLVQAAWIGQQTNPWMKQTYERVWGGKPDRKKKAIVAVARKLFVRLWAMDRDEKDWSGPAAVKRPLRRPMGEAEPAVVPAGAGGKRRSRIVRWGSAPNPASLASRRQGVKAAGEK